ncbi:MAG TPA: YggS family pyridoxal phosphate-dependent enzyme [Gammaproteobacteria bacterium]|nr:YggS family pyridoxal phosphate-dependent enzyme [Gammaproteobacteria bacterium]
MIPANLTHIKKQISEYEKKYSRPEHSVSLLAASKKQSSDKIREAYSAGQRVFGENYLQEALLKMQELSDLQIEWHFIGPIQSNKTKKIAQHFDWVQSVDSIKIAERLNNQRPSHLPPLNICMEVNISDEASKSGVTIADVHSLAAACKSFPRLKLRGLMTIPAPAANFAEARKQFHRLYDVYQQLNAQNLQLDTLSMGMSDDFEAAIAEGSTLVRIGTAIFGARS